VFVLVFVFVLVCARVFTWLYAGSRACKPPPLLRAIFLAFRSLSLNALSLSRSEIGLTRSVIGRATTDANFVNWRISILVNHGIRQHQYDLTIDKTGSLDMERRTPISRAFRQVSNFYPLTFQGLVDRREPWGTQSIVWMVTCEWSRVNGHVWMVTCEWSRRRGLVVCATQRIVWVVE